MSMLLSLTWFRAPPSLALHVHLLIACIHSTQEKRIIEHPKSCYVIGRSGTGYAQTVRWLHSLAHVYLT